MSNEWQSMMSFENLKQRAELLKQIRYFFQTRHIMEVETPILSHATVTDPNLHSLSTTYQFGTEQKKLYLQTSPEYAMKRLLAVGSGAIYQITKSFRNDEYGRFHNPEFTMLEWYRPGFNHHQLMDEMNDLLKAVLNTHDAIRMSYAELFNYYMDVNPHACSISDLKQRCLELGIQHAHFQEGDKDFWLQLVMSHYIEPQLKQPKQPYFIYDFPASQAALARLRHEDDVIVAERFELYLEGIELANGFHELADASEQRKRFINDLHKRQQQKLPAVPVDERLLAALNHRFPDCAGVALGIDRLMMIALNAKHINEVISFTVDAA